MISGGSLPGSDGQRPSKKEGLFLLLTSGGAVKAGLFGKYPSLTDLDYGDLKFNTDFRSVYGTVLDQWGYTRRVRLCSDGNFRHLPIIQIVRTALIHRIAGRSPIRSLVVRRAECRRECRTVRYDPKRACPWINRAHPHVPQFVPPNRKSRVVAVVPPKRSR
jgi:hypothetical protein